MPPKMPPTTSLVCGDVPLLEDAEDAEVEVEEEVPADAVVAPEPSLPSEEYVAEAESDDHAVDDDPVVQVDVGLSNGLDAELRIELKRVVEDAEGAVDDEEVKDCR